MARFEYDMVVIGAGAAGLTAAGMSAVLGAKTALIERARLGGDCTWTGCVPSKTLLRAARAAHEMRTADRFGLAPVDPQFTFARVMEHVRETRQSIYQDTDAPPRMEKLGVEVTMGQARFVDPHSVEVEGDGGGIRRITSRFFLITTGSRPKMPEFAEAPLTNETIFEIIERPERLAILGGGPVGIELAQAFRRLGSAVEVVHSGGRILPHDDPEHAGRLRQVLENEGVIFHLQRKAIGLSRSERGYEVALDDGTTLRCDLALSAMGREPGTAGLQLEKAGVQAGEKGIEIDRHCRTSQRNIFAAGDVTGRYNFTHMAEHMAKVAVWNAVLRWPKTWDEAYVVWATFTDPELAHLGESEKQLGERHASFAVLRFPFSALDRAVTEAETEGEVKVFADSTGRILGVSILGARAGEMISEWAVAMRNGLKLPKIAGTIHPYPTFLLGNRRTADRFTEKGLDSPLLGVLRWVLRYRGQRKGSGALQSDSQ